jgi:16S rRNA (adenine1518-N6/adenine1519-N6)-dimethyltransferase
LASDLAAVLGMSRGARVIGNLPYNIASPILFKLVHDVDSGAGFVDATVMLQREVANRLAASPGSPDYGGLAIQASRVAEVTSLLTLPPGAFRPPPKVTSAVVRLRFVPSRVDVGDVGTFERLVRGAFLQRRKMIQIALVPVADSLGRSASELIARAGIDPQKRPEALTLEEFARLSRAVL